MSNRNFDASVITRRLRDKSVASNFITSMRNGMSFGNPQTYNANTSIINEVVNGKMTTVYRGDICVTYDIGCPCIIPITSAEIPVIPLIPSGQVLWATNISGLGQDVGYGIITDSLNNIYVTGEYNSNPVIFNSYSTISSGTIVVSSFGTLSTSGSLDAFVAKYNSSGQVLWATNVGGAGSDSGFGITTDSLNNIYVTGQYSTTSVIFNSYSTISSGAIIVSSFGTLSTSGSSDVFISKYDSVGQVLWATNIGGAGSDNGRGITSDSLNNSYVTGRYASNPVIFNSYSTISSGTILVSSFGTLSTSGSFDAFIAKYNSSGQVLWATAIRGNSTENVYSISTDSLNNIYVTGEYASNPVIFNSYSTISSGTILVSSFGTLSTSGSFDAFIAKYNSSGQVLWATNVGGAGSDSGFGISTDSLNNIYVTGNYASNPVIFNSYSTISSGAIVVSSFGTLSTSGLIDAFVAKYNSSGQVLWATNVGGAGSDSGFGISTDSLNNIYVTGQYSTTSVIFNSYSTISSGAIVVSSFGTLSTSGGNDAFVAKYNSSGQVLWATNITGAGIDSGRGITSDSFNDIYVIGPYNSNPVRFNSYSTISSGTIVVSSFGTLSTSGSFDVFIAKYSG
jgi:hypothetical protein